MDEFWKGINLSPFHPPAAAAAASAAFASGAGFSHTPVLQEFLRLPIDSGGSTSSPLALFSPDAAESPPAPPPPPPVRKRRREIDSGSDPERRHQRLIRNRDSADRSRAKKIAYTKELEIKVDYLKQENAKLKMQRVKLLSLGIPAAAAIVPPEENKKLCRSLTF